MSLPIFEDDVWQMAWGERAAIEGLLAQVRPHLAVEVGTAEGACLTRIAEWAGEVHSFDLGAPSLPLPEHVTLHTGDSHELLPRWLAEQAEQGRNVDFAVVDGDHSPEGVRRDLEDLLNSPALRHCVIVIHDTANPQVRQGLDGTPFAAWPKVSYVDLDWVPGRLFEQLELRGELWYGLGLVLVDVEHLAWSSGDPYERRYYPAAELVRGAGDILAARELAPADLAGAEPARLRRVLREQNRLVGVGREREVELRERLRVLEEGMEERMEERLAEVNARLLEAEARRERADRVLEDVFGSLSWRMTRPLRSAKRRNRHG